MDATTIEATTLAITKLNHMTAKQKAVIAAVIFAYGDNGFDFACYDDAQAHSGMSSSSFKGVIGSLSSGAEPALNVYHDDLAVIVELGSGLVHGTAHDLDTETLYSWADRIN